MNSGHRDQTFGERLRQRREEKKIDLGVMSEQTKIKLSLLEGLERDDVSQWPSGIFRRAYIRTYAQFIGLDPDVVVKEFLEAHRDPGDAFVITPENAAAAEEEFAKTAPSMRLRTIVDSALGSLTRLRRPPAADVPAASSMPPVTDSVEPVAARSAERLEEPLEIDMATEQAEEAADEPLESQPSAQVEAEESPITAPAPDEEPTVTSEAAVVSEIPAKVSEPPPTDQAIARAIATQLQAAHDVRLENVARLCTEFGRAKERNEVQQLLQETAVALNASGLIVWLWDDAVDALKPALVHGYSERVLAHVPAVRHDSDNATAAAFRSMTPCEVAASSQTSGALVVPMLIPEGCAGVLALELQPGIQPVRSLRAMATVLAAALTQLVYRSQAAGRPGRTEPAIPAAGLLRPPVPPVKVRR